MGKLVKANDVRGSKIVSNMVKHVQTAQHSLKSSISVDFRLHVHNSASLIQIIQHFVSFCSDFSVLYYHSITASQHITAVFSSGVM